MKIFKRLSWLILTLALLSACEKSSETISSTTTTGTEFHTQSQIKIVLIDSSFVPQPGIHVLMSESVISWNKPFTTIQSSICDSNGVAFFDMRPYEYLMPKIFYFGAFMPDGDNYWFAGSKTIKNVTVNNEYMSVLFLYTFEE